MQVHLALQDDASIIPELASCRPGTVQPAGQAPGHEVKNERDFPRRFDAAVCEVVRQVPEGRVVTYGQVAALAGWPRRARHVGRVLANLPDDTDLPWQRVVNAGGRISRRPDSPGISEGFQRHLLEEEGVVFSGTGRVDLQRFQWEPEMRLKEV